MANDGTIASKLQLDGEQQYKKALNDAYRSLRVLKSELKAETAELGRNATEQDKARAKMQSLQKQIAEQEKIVKTLEKALADSKKEYADNQEVQDKWAEKLNKAREALANMQNQMGACQDSLEKFGGSMKDVANDSGDAMQTVISFNDAMRSIGSIASGIGESLSGIFSATVDTMRDMVEEMFSLMSMAWSAAGDWKAIQEMWGGDLAEIQKVYTSMEIEGIDASEITSGIQKLVNNTHSGNKETLTALEKLHIEEKTYSNHWDYFMDVMKALAMHNGTEQEDLVRDIFGDKKGSGMMRALAHWTDGFRKYENDFEKTGIAKTSEELVKLDDVGQQIQEIQRLWQGIQESIGAKLIDVLQMDDRTKEVLTLLQDVGLLLNGEGDKKEIVLKLSEDLNTIFSGISESIGTLSGFLNDLSTELEKSDNPLVSTIGNVIGLLSDVLSWLSAHGAEITSALESLLPMILQNKMVEMFTGKGIFEWVESLLKLGLDVAVLGKIFGTSAGAAIGGTAATFGAGIGEAILKAVPSLGAVLGGASNGVPVIDWFTHNTHLGRALLGQEEWSDVGNAYSEWFNHTFSQENADDFVNNWDPFSEDANVIAKGVGSLITGLINAGIPTGETEQGLLTLTDTQRTAAETYWDLLRTGEDSIYDWDEFRAAFDGQDEIFESLNALINELNEDNESRKLENLPESWFSEVSAALKNLTRDNYKGTTDDNLPARLEAAVERGSSKKPVHVVVQLEGQTILNYTDRELGGRLSKLLG